MTIRLSNPTGRKTEARILELPCAILFFSYETCIAFEFFHGGTGAGMRGIRSLRRPNDWGPTTGRHFRELECADFPMAESGDSFEAILDEVIATGL